MSPLVLPDRYLTSELYRGILRNTLVTYARQHFGDNYHYQDDNATLHHTRVVLNSLQQGDITKMEEPRRSPYCNPIEQIWDVLDCGITRMHNSPRNHGELCQALLDKCADISVECLQRLVASIPRLLVAIIAARGGNTRHCRCIHKTTPTGSIMQKKIKFV